MKNLKIFTALILFTACNSLLAQKSGVVLHQAMEQEISRTLKDLHLEGMKDPFYIGLNILDFNNLSIYSSLGSLVRISGNKNRYAFNNQLLVGDYNNNNLNYTDAKSMMYFLQTLTSIPLDNTPSAVRRKLWILFDRSYKLSAEIYESKLSALKNVAQSEDIAGLADFTSGEKILIEKPEIPLNFNNENLIKYSDEISLALKSYRFLTNSWVRLICYKANVYFSNSDGSRATYPVSLFRLAVNVETQSPTGEVLELFKTYHALNEADLPDKQLIIKESMAMAEKLDKMRTAPVFDDVYNGPVLFEGQAAGEVVRKTMFYQRNENLFSARKQVMATPAGSQSQQNKISTDDRIDKKIAADGLNVKALPALTTYNGTLLVGSYPVDMEGTIPPKEVVLIENGILKNLLCSRVPTAKMTASNGHLRVPLSLPNPQIVPGVIDVDFTGSQSKEDLKKKLIEMAQGEGLEYALIVRDMSPIQSELKEVYMVDLKTGEEKLIRALSFKGLALNDLRKIMGASSQKIIINTTAGEDPQHKSDFLNGCPASFITPDAFLFKDIEINKVNRPPMNKLPIVKNPLEL